MKTLKIIVSAIGILCALLYIRANIGWAPYRMNWLLYSFVSGNEDVPYPFASAWYRVEVTNATQESLLVNVTLVNDRFFAPAYSSISVYNKERLGRVSEKGGILAPGESSLFDLPSPVEPRLGFVMVAAMSVTDEKDTPQKISMRMHSWWRTDKPKAPCNINKVRFTDDDMIALSGPDVSTWPRSMLALTEEGLGWVAPETPGQTPGDTQ